MSSAAVPAVPLSPLSEVSEQAVGRRRSDSVNDEEASAAALLGPSTAAAAESATPTRHRLCRPPPFLPQPRRVGHRSAACWRSLRPSWSCCACASAVVTLTVAVALYLGLFFTPCLLYHRYLLSALAINLLPPSLASPLLSELMVTDRAGAERAASHLYSLYSSPCPTDAQLRLLSASALSSPHIYHSYSYQSPVLDLHSPLPPPYTPPHLLFPSCPTPTPPPLKAAVVLLVGPHRPDRSLLIRSLRLFSRHVNAALDTAYPAYVVYAPGEWEDAERQLKAPVMEALADELSARRWEVRFLPHTLAFPSAYNGSGQSSVDPSPRSASYALMCRFWFSQVFELPEVAALDYLMRLDDDSALQSDWRFDPFTYMQAHRMHYAYLHAAMDDPQWTRLLWPFIADYSAHHRPLPPSIPTGLSYFPTPSPSSLAFLASHSSEWDAPHTTRFPQLYNNFEVAHVAFFRQAGVRHFMEWVDAHEPYGVYRLRWGDAPLRFATLGLFGRDEGTLMLNMLYQHPGWFEWKHIPPRPISWLRWT